MSIINTFTIHNAFFIVGDIFNLIIMLGSAGLGLCLIVFILCGVFDSITT